MVSALRKLGADFVLDVAFSADLTIMEEGRVSQTIYSRFPSIAPVYKLLSGMGKIYRNISPERIPCLSSTKSPISMQGALIKTYFLKKRD